MTNNAPGSSGLLADHLEGRNNSLDLLRLIAASLVIYGHSFAVLNAGADLMSRWNGYVYSGKFAVEVFFFISGLLVTNSFLRKPNILRWVSSRALRIVPALSVCLFVSVFLFGAILTQVPLKSYFAAPQTWDYFAGNLLVLNTRYYLPGVFANNFDHAVNGPLWSLYVEVRCYLFAALLLWTFRGRPRQWITAALGAVALIALVKPAWLFVFMANDNNATCSLMFLLGALCALWSDKVIISNVWLAVLLLAICHYTWTPAFRPLSVIFTCYFVLCFGFSRWLSRIHLPGDYSYGLYIYGWPVQQVMAMLFPQTSTTFNTVSSLLVTLGVAALSWHLIEKPCLALKKSAGRVDASPAKRKTPVLAFACAAIVLIILAGIFALRPVGSADAKSLAAETIQDFGPRSATAGQGFNVQRDGRSAIWVQLTTPATTQASIVFRGRKLDTVVSDKLLTANVPPDLLAEPGSIELYVVDEGYTPARKSPPSQMTLKAK